MYQAVLAGYKIHDIFMSHQYNERYPHFQEFIEEIIKLKHKAEEDKKSGKRSLFKLMGNSFWGILGRNPVSTSTTFVDVKGLYLLLADKEFKISEIISFGNIARIEYQDKNRLFKHLQIQV